MSQEKEANLGIDPNNLDLNCINHPRQVRYWGRELASAKRLVQEKKNALRLRLAEFRTQVRRDPGLYGIEKTTVDAIEDAVVQIDGYQIAQDELVMAEEQADLMKAEVEGLREKGDRIGDMVRLYGQMYFSKPAVSPEGKAAVLDRQSQQRMASTGDAAAEGLNKQAPKKPAKPK